jgi:hypothetical protein
VQAITGLQILFVHCGVHSMHPALKDLPSELPEFSDLLGVLRQVFSFLRPMTQRLIRVVRCMQISAPMDDEALRAVEASLGRYLEGGMPSSCHDSMREFPANEARREWWAQWLASPRPSLRALARPPPPCGSCQRASLRARRLADRADLRQAEVPVP